MQQVPRVRFSSYKGKVIVHLTNGTLDPNDYRSAAPREESLSPTDAVRLIRQLAGAILRAQLWRRQNRAAAPTP